MILPRSAPTALLELDRKQNVRKSLNIARLDAQKNASLSPAISFVDLSLTERNLSPALPCYLEGSSLLSSTHSSNLVHNASVPPFCTQQTGELQAFRDRESVAIQNKKKDLQRFVFDSDGVDKFQVAIDLPMKNGKKHKIRKFGCSGISSTSRLPREIPSLASISNQNSFSPGGGYEKFNRPMT